MASIGKGETVFYFAVWIFSVIWSLIELLRQQNEIIASEYFEKEKIEGLLPSWGHISRFRDGSDSEWSTWLHQFQISWHYLLVLSFVNEVIRTFKFKQSHYYRALCTFVFLYLILDLQKLLILVTEPVLFLILLHFGLTKVVLWAGNITLLIGYSYMKENDGFWDYMLRNTNFDEEIYMLLFSLGWIHLRCTSFCFDHFDSSKQLGSSSKKNKWLGLDEIAKFFAYVLYLPALASGPLILYSDFEKSFMTTRSYSLRIKTFITHIIVLLSYALLLQLANHFVYIYAFQSDIQLLRKMTTLAIYGGGIWMGIEFHLKYVVSYGVANAFALLDNVETPPLPRCILRVHLYSKMWRYFDVGMYKFLVKYIYKPCLELSKSNGFSPNTQKLFASLPIFAFVYIWHGMIMQIFIWNCLNFIVLFLENCGKIFYRTDSYKRFKENVLRTESMEQRFIALLCSPLLALSAISNFYMFSGTEMGNVFFERFIQSFPSCAFFSLMFALYSCCHVSMTLDNVAARSIK